MCRVRSRRSSGGRGGWFRRWVGCLGVDDSIGACAIVAASNGGYFDVAVDVSLAREPATVAHAVEAFAEVGARCGTLAFFSQPYCASAAEAVSSAVEASKELAIDVNPLVDRNLSYRASLFDVDLAVFHEELGFRHGGWTDAYRFVREGASGCGVVIGAGGCCA